MKSVLTILFCFLVQNATAADFFLIEESLPDTVRQVAAVNSLPENNQPYTTPLGVTSRCYQANELLVLSDNSLGSGYELTYIAPENATCITLNKPTTPVQNNAGMFLGMSKADAIKILKAPQATDSTTLLYNSEKIIDGKKLDEQTWIDVEFSDAKLQRLKVFTSLTN